MFTAIKTSRSMLGSGTIIITTIEMIAAGIPIWPIWRDLTGPHVLGWTVLGLWGAVLAWTYRHLGL